MLMREFGHTRGQEATEGMDWKKLFQEMYASQGTLGGNVARSFCHPACRVPSLVHTGTPAHQDPDFHHEGNRTKTRYHAQQADCSTWGDISRMGDIFPCPVIE